MIEVLKKMVEALEWCHGGEPIGTAEAIQAGKQAIKELKSQKPFAWRIKVETKLRDGSVDVGYQLRNEKLSVYDEPLYTHPPQRTEGRVCCQQYDICVEPCTSRGRHLAQRTWVGLTDDELCDIWYKESLDWMEYGKAIEAKLKEKNT
jgi:hypothetical protein